MRPSFAYTPEQLLEHGRSLRALARGLLVDDGAAEDVVQEAWVLALERPPAERERIGGWLHTVVRTLAQKRLRGERRRAWREAAAARPEATASAAETIEGAALCKRLVDAVVALEEPYRTAISMRYFEDLPPREIAERLGVPKNTLRSRLQRGLAMLRHRLDGDSEGGRETWARALLVFAGLQDGSGVAPAAPATLGSAFGVVTMAGLIKCVAGLLVAALAGFGLMQVAGERDTTPARESASAAERTAGVGELVELQDGARTGRQPELAPSETVDTAGLAQPAAPPWSTTRRHPFEVQGRVVDAWGRPVRSAEVFVAVAGQRFNRSEGSDDDGRFAVHFQAATPQVELQLFVRIWGRQSSGIRSLSLTSGAERRIHIDLVDTRTSAGEEQRNPLLPLGNSPGLHGRADAPVRFYSDSGVDVGLPEEDILEFEESVDEFGVMAPSTPDQAAFAGVVRAADGQPARRTLVGVKLDGKGPGSWVSTNDAGEWRIDGLDPGAYTLRAGGGDYGLAGTEMQVGAGEVQTWDPWLDRGRQLRGRLVGPQGEPLPFHVCAEAQDPTVEWSDTTRAADDGRFAIPNAPGGPLRLLVFDLRESVWEVPLHVVEGVHADGIEGDLVLSERILERGELSLSLLDAAGAPVTSGEVRLVHRASGRGTLMEAAPTEDDPARYTAPGLPAGEYRVEAGSPRHGWLDLGTVELAPGQRLELGSSGFPAPGLLVASAEVADLEHARHWKIVHVGPRVDSFAWQGWPLDAWEWADQEAPGWAKVELPPGDYLLSTGSEKTGEAWFPFAIDSGGQTELELPLALLSDVTLRLARGELAATATLSATLTDAGSGAAVLRTTLEPGSDAWTVKLLPGSYRVEVTGESEALGEATLQVQPATSERVSIGLR